MKLLFTLSLILASAAQAQPMTATSLLGKTSMATGDLNPSMTGVGMQPGMSFQHGAGFQSGLAPLSMLPIIDPMPKGPVIQAPTHPLISLPVYRTPSDWDIFVDKAIGFFVEPFIDFFPGSSILIHGAFGNLDLVGAITVAFPRFAIGFLGAFTPSYIANENLYFKEREILGYKDFAWGTPQNSVSRSIVFQPVEGIPPSTVPLPNIGDVGLPPIQMPPGAMDHGGSFGPPTGGGSANGPCIGCHQGTLLERRGATFRGVSDICIVNGKIIRKVGYSC